MQTRDVFLTFHYPNNSLRSTSMINSHNFPFIRFWSSPIRWLVGLTINRQQILYKLFLRYLELLDQALYAAFEKATWLYSRNMSVMGCVSTTQISNAFSKARSTGSGIGIHRLLSSLVSHLSGTKNL